MPKRASDPCSCGHERLYHYTVGRSQRLNRKTGDCQAKRDLYQCGCSLFRLDDVYWEELRVLTLPDA